MEAALAGLFVIIANCALWWAAIVHGLGITPKSWLIVVVCWVLQVTLGVIVKFMHRRDSK